jgi:hypothetical protein
LAKIIWNEFRRPYDAKDHPDWEEDMLKLMGFSRFAALVEEQISEKISRRILSGDQGMVVWWSIGAGVHVEPHSHPNEQIVWMLKGKMEFRLGNEQRVCGQGDVVSFREVRSTRHGSVKTPR